MHATPVTSPRRSRLRTWAPLGIAALVIAEVAAFILIAQQIGYVLTVLAGLVLSMLGAVVLRREGLRGWQRFREASRVGRHPGPEGVDGLIGIVAGVLLSVPGFITDAIGLLLVIPPFRGLARRTMIRSMERRLPSARAGDLFGPRRVRPANDYAHTAPPQSASTEAKPGEPVIEGEIV